MKNAALIGWTVILGLVIATPLYASPDEAMLARLSIERPDALTSAEAEGLLHWLTHESLPVRAWAAELLLTRDNPYQVSAVWLLAHDPSPILQQEALEYVQTECNSRTHLCPPMLRFLIRSKNIQTASWARIELFQYEPELALRGASRVLILDLLSQLSGELEGDRIVSKRWALERLNQHADLEVRETAQRALNYLEP